MGDDRRVRVGSRAGEPGPVGCTLARPTAREGRCARASFCARASEDALRLCARASEDALRLARTLHIALWSALAACTPTVGDTVDLGDNPETPDVSLDENFFHCQIQPLVLSAQGCASGGAGEAGSCHSARSALRLVSVPSPSICQNNRVIGSAASESIVNLERVRSSVGADADASPLYRRPLGLDSHPRVIFAADSESAALLRMWLNGQAAP